MDGGPAQRTAKDTMDELKHLAKVRVAGSNPVFRSILAGQKQFLNPLLGTQARPPWIVLPDASSDHTAIQPSSIASNAAERNRDAATNESDASRGAVGTGSDSIRVFRFLRGPTTP